LRSSAKVFSSPSIRRVWQFLNCAHMEDSLQLAAVVEGLLAGRKKVEGT
jgi:hypothetical protein